MSAEILQTVLEAELVSPGKALPSGGTGLSIDTRSLLPGEIFFAIPGTTHDGHDYVEAAFRRGAAAAVINRSQKARFAANSPGLLIVVEDTHKALLEMARYLRRDSRAAFAGITGSNGKTTTKEMLYAVMSVRHRAYRSPGNLNNLFGAPIALGRMPQNVQYAIFEMGISYPGEMTRLAGIIQPEIAVMTNIGPAHLETLKTVDQIVQAKFELIDHLPAGAAIVLNSDDPRLVAEARRRNLAFTAFGVDADCPFRAKDIRLTLDRRISFTVSDQVIELPVLGRANVYNALAAVAAASVWGVRPEDWAVGLAAFEPAAMRLTLEHYRGLDLLIDCYNANPESVKEALRTLQGFAVAGRKIAVLGDMLELGDLSDALHVEIGRTAAAAGIDFLLCLGPHSAATVDGARAAGMKPDMSRHYATHQELLEALAALVRPGDMVLFKGSRGMELEKIVVGLKGSAFAGN
ncbi:MAG: UDP-N-acetylmuramoyl-tripeptide--D-alanyl-D-alanine ligase [candidate division Zixibacteria bacterium]|nr:UDP-N-acetylmuramoyl-tripeptide--D-alanyl-D-alanine ligase [candidate division Zixibacteria bacterium]